MQRPPDNVVRGLKTISGFIGAGSSADILGYDEDVLNNEQKRDWQDILDACEWILNL